MKTIRFLVFAAVIVLVGALVSADAPRPLSERVIGTWVVFTMVGPAETTGELTLRLDEGELTAVFLDDRAVPPPAIFRAAFERPECWVREGVRPSPPARSNPSRMNAPCPCVMEKP